jgi:hypothetical protein
VLEPSVLTQLSVAIPSRSGLSGAGHLLERKIRLEAISSLDTPMTPEERQELRQCSERIAELLYQEACE